MIQPNPPVFNKKQAEQQIAGTFLLLYNAKFLTDFQIVEHSDTPDFKCRDPHTHRALDIEVSLLDDLPGWIEHVLTGKARPVSPHTGTTAVSFPEDVVPLFEQQIGRKLLSSYGANTALVLSNTTPLWSPLEWHLFKERYGPSLLAGKEHQYGAGIWVICTDSSAWPHNDVLFCLSEPHPSAA